jgi:hypothetical protein
MSEMHTYEIKTINEQLRELQDALQGKYPQITKDDCHEKHIQNCNWCPDFECCDNLTPQGTIVKLQKQVKKLRAALEYECDDICCDRSWKTCGRDCNIRKALS